MPFQEFAARRGADVAFGQFGPQLCRVSFRHAQDPADGAVHQGGPKIEMQRRAQRKDCRTSVVQYKMTDAQRTQGHPQRLLRLAACDGYGPWRSFPRHGIKDQSHLDDVNTQ